jgi:excisionase family DNA binding protein
MTDPILDAARQALAETPLRRGRYPEPRITDLDTHPDRFVCLIVAAEYLELDVRTLDRWIDEGRIVAVPFGRRRKIAKDELQRVTRERIPHAS